MIILGIETSCDETSASLVKSQANNLKTLSHIVSSQVKIHAQWGGVVPHLAAREHLRNIVPVLKTAFQKAKTKPSDIDLIAVTQGPGLIPALLIGTNAAKTLSYLWQKPLIGIHHIEGHIYANFISDKISVISPPKADQPQAGNFQKNPKLRVTSYELQAPFPILCLVVSGGHTQLVLMKKHLDYKIVGQTLDDAVGEAFDKTARILKLGYPGGPAISQLAKKYKNCHPEFISGSQIKNKKTPKQVRDNISLPRPMINSNDFNFSFSGLKTAVLYEVKKIKSNKIEKLKANIAAEFQQAALDVLIHKTMKAAKKYHPKTIILAGGVSANKELRKQLGEKIKEEIPGTEYILPETEYCGDNAAMIAAAGFYRWKNMPAIERKNSLQNWKILQADANLKLE